MSLHVVDLSIVVLAEDHNPTILHHAFLKAREIVPPDWEPLPSECFTTPPFSQVKYANGIIVTVELSKLQIVDSKPPSDCRESRIACLARDYLATLPHVKYTAVGINLTGFRANPNAKSYLVERFLKDGPWNEPPLQIKALSTTFMFSLSDADFRLVLDAANIVRAPSPEQMGVVVKANYHSPLKSEGTPDVLSQAKQLISAFRTRCDHFQSVVPSILGEEH